MVRSVLKFLIWDDKQFNVGHCKINCNIGKKIIWIKNLLKIVITNTNTLINLYFCWLSPYLHLANIAIEMCLFGLLHVLLLIWRTKNVDKTPCVGFSMSVIENFNSYKYGNSAYAKTTKIPINFHSNVW